MKILIRQANITDSHSPHHNTIADIFIEEGMIVHIGPNLTTAADLVISEQDLHVSPGWVDVFADFADPGYEYKEDLVTGANTAAAGGYTDIFVVPNTNPVVDIKAQVEYIRQKSAGLPVNVFPIGAVTRNTDGKNLAEMYDMHSSGAIAFGDGVLPVQSAGLLLKALQYVKAFDGVIIQVPDDKSVGADGLINEGIVSTRLGLPGKPAMAEELIIARDIKLARYAESRIHFTGVTSPKSIEYIKRAKAAGLEVTCSVTPYHLYFSDEDLTDYDTNLKVYPPLRTKSDSSALKKAVLEGAVDCIASHHQPHEYDSKVVEFEHAKYGMTGLETTYAVIKTLLPELSEDRLIALFSGNARNIFRLPTARINIGEPASLTLYNPSKKWIPREKDIRSKSKNTAFLNKELTGKVLGIINGKKVFLNN